jgi:hypothetical protein
MAQTADRVMIATDVIKLIAPEVTIQLSILYDDIFQ